MSDTFTFVAPVMARRRLDPFATRFVALALALVVVVAALGTFVVRAERAADARRAGLQAQEDAREVAEAQRLAAEAEAGLARQETAMTTVPAGVARLLDERRRARPGARAGRARPHRRPVGRGRHRADPA
jgi:hypothetical protein